MKRKSYAIVAIIITAVAVVALAGSLVYYYGIITAQKENPTDRQENIPTIIIPPGITDPQNIKDGKIQLQPKIIKVVIGENNTVQWKNNDSRLHRIEPDPSRDSSFNANAIAPSNSLKFTFAKPGAYTYSVGPGQVGRVIVVGKGGTSANYSSPEPIYVIEIPGASRMALNSSSDKLYVTSPGSIYTISTLTNVIERNSTIEKNSYKMAFDNATNNIYLINGESGYLYTIDGESGSTVSKIHLAGTNPIDVAANANTGKIYVNYASLAAKNAGIFVIDAATKKVIDNIASSGDSWYQLAVNPITNKIYAIDQPNHSVVVIDGSTDRIVHSIAGIQGTSHGIAINPVTNRIYVNNFDANQGDANTLTVIDGTRDEIISNITLSEGWKDLQLDAASVGLPRVAIDTERNVVYGTNYLSKSVSIIDGSSGRVLSKIRLDDDNPLDVVADSRNGRVYVSSIHSISIFLAEG